MPRNKNKSVPIFMGKILTANEQVANPYRYAGYRYDGSTGLYYLQHRYYKPDIYRFVSKDQYPADLRNPQTLNPYAYVTDNPVSWIDPSGLSPKDKVLTFEWRKFASIPTSVQLDVVVAGAGIASPSKYLFVAANELLTTPEPTGGTKIVAGFMYVIGGVMLGTGSYVMLSGTLGYFPYPAISWREQ